MKKMNMQSIKIVFLSLVALCVATSAGAKLAQYDRLSVGLGAGYGSGLPVWKIPANSGLQSLNAKNSGGFNGLIDVRYSHFWKPKQDFGITTGLELSYLNETYSMAWDEKFVSMYGEVPVTYNVSAKSVKENLNVLNISIPVMFAMKMDNGLLLHAGPKVMYTVLANYSPSIISPSISTLYGNGFNVPVANEDMMKLIVTDQLNQGGKSNYQGVWRVLLGVDAGYEWELPYNNSISLGGFLNVGVFSTYRHNEAITSVIMVTPLSENKGTATNYPISDVVVDRLSYLDVGIKIAYHLSFGKKTANYRSYYTTKRKR